MNRHGTNEQRSKQCRNHRELDNHRQMPTSRYTRAQRPGWAEKFLTGPNGHVVPGTTRASRPPPCHHCRRIRLTGCYRVLSYQMPSALHIPVCQAARDSNFLVGWNFSWSINSISLASFMACPLSCVLDICFCSPPLFISMRRRKDPRARVPVRSSSGASHSILGGASVLMYVSISSRPQHRGIQDEVVVVLGLSLLCSPTMQVQMERGRHSRFSGACRCCSDIYRLFCGWAVISGDVYFTQGYCLRQ